MSRATDYHLAKLSAFCESMVQVAKAEIMSTVSLPEAQARDIAINVAQRICTIYGGQSFYIPTSMAPGCNPRNDEIVRKYGAPAQCETSSRPFTGQRIDELALEYKLTIRAIRTILSNARKR